ERSGVEDDRVARVASWRAPLSTSGPPRRGSPAPPQPPPATAPPALGITPPPPGAGPKRRALGGGATYPTPRPAAHGHPRGGGAEAGFSLVVPLFNGAAILGTLHARIVEVVRALRAERGLATEAVYMEDGSRDATLSAARELPAENLDIQVISLSRNFGKE